MYIFDLWCTEEGTNAEKTRSVINLLEQSITNNKGYAVEMNQLKNCVSYICTKKKIIAYWAKYNRIKSSIVQYQSNWLNTLETIIIKPTNFSQQMVSSVDRGRPQIDFAESSKRTKRHRIALLENDDDMMSLQFLFCAHPIFQAALSHPKQILKRFYHF